MTTGKSIRKEPGQTARKSSGPREDVVQVLLNTAQQLFADKGIDAVSLREIARESGQRNNSVLQYHLGSKEALVQAILQRGMSQVDALRNDFVDKLFLDGRQSELRALAEAIVWPLASGMAMPQGNSYNRFLAAVQAHTDLELIVAVRDDRERGFRRIFELLTRVLPELPETVLSQRYLACLSMVIFSLADYERIRRRRQAKSRDFDLQRAIENLIDMLCGALSFPASAAVVARVEEPPAGKARSAARKAAP